MPEESGSGSQFSMPPERAGRLRLLVLTALIAGLLAAGVLLYGRQRTGVVEVLEDAPPPPPAGAIITVVPTPDDATVMLDGVRIDTRVALPVDPGAHTLTAEREGFDRVDRSLTLKPGEPIEVRLNLERAGASTLTAAGAAAATATAGSEAQARAVPRHRRRSKTKAEKPRPQIPGVIYLDWKKSQPERASP